MKKLFTTFILLIVGVTISQVHAVDYYSLFVGGVQVTSSNASNIDPVGLASGTITYDDSNKTLKLYNVKLTNSNIVNFIVNVGISDLEIIVKGKCEVWCRRYMCLR